MTNTASAEASPRECRSKGQEGGFLQTHVALLLLLRVPCSRESLELCCYRQATLFQLAFSDFLVYSLRR